MNRRWLLLLALPALTLPFASLATKGEETKGETQSKEALAKNADAFVEAFHKGDAKALAAFWAPDGDYTDQKGRHLKGRAAIEKVFAGLFAENKGLKVRIDSDSLRFVTPEVAIEDGTTAVIAPDGAPPSRAHYTIVHVKKDGQWYLGSVRDRPFAAPSNYEHLRPLEWLVGEWATKGEKGDVARLSVVWAENQNFLTATFSTVVKGVVVGSASHRVGWDPNKKVIRSWIFDVSGGFGEGAWSADGKKWLVKTSSVLQDGKKATATFVLTPGGPDTLTLQATGRTVGGVDIPDVREVTLKRLD